MTNLRRVHDPDSICYLAEVHLAQVLRHTAFNRLRLNQLVQALARNILLDEYPVTFVGPEISVELWEVIAV